MINKIFLIFLFLVIDFAKNGVSTFDLIDSNNNYGASTFNSNDSDENEVTTFDPIESTTNLSSPTIIKEITFYKDKKTIDGNNQLNCINLDGKGYCKKFELNSVTCKMIDNKFICDSSDLKLLITFYDYNGWCRKEIPLSSKLPYLYYKETCYLKYSLTVNWLTIVGIVIVILIFLPCIIGMLFYGLLILNMKIQRRNRSSDRNELIDDNISENIY